jgi:hypothetical protein
MKFIIGFLAIVCSRAARINLSGTGSEIHMNGVRGAESNHHNHMNPRLTPTPSRPSCWASS